jgi:hypothetical protein
VAQCGVFGAADAVLHSGMTPVAALEIGDVGVGRVGDVDPVAPAVRIEEVELGPVVGFFSPDDGPGALRLAGALGGPIAGNSARSICWREAALRGWGP